MNGVNRDFGLGYVFLDKRMATPDLLSRLTTGQARQIPSDKWDYALTVYTGGDFSQVVCQRKRIPTFDSSDRMYDSWHDLYLIREKDGKLWAVYATGGYQVSSVESWQKVVACPSSIRELLES